MPKARIVPLHWRTRLQRLAWRLPPLQRADARFHEVEAEMLKGLKRRLADLDTSVPPSSDPAVPFTVPSTPRATSLSSDLSALLALSQDAAPEHLERINQGALIAPFCPDEARVLAALSDGSRFPMLALRERALLGRGPVLHRYSSVGRRAGVQCQDLVPLYLQRLIGAGLALPLPGDATLRVEYELCESDSGFRRARDHLQAAVRRLGTQRETLMISPAGAGLWQALMTPPEEE